MNARWLLLGLLGAGLLTACSSSPDLVSLPNSSFEKTSDQGLVSATIDLKSGRLMRGQNTFLVTLEPVQAGSIVELTAGSGLMPAHGHTADGIITHIDGEPDEVTMDLFMAGRWDITFELTVDAASDTITFPLDVP